MRNPRENSFIILFDLLIDLGKAYKKGVVLLFSQQERKIIPLNNTALNLFHLLITQGPKSFQKLPSGIKLGRALFVPLIFLFKKK